MSTPEGQAAVENYVQKTTDQEAVPKWYEPMVRDGAVQNQDYTDLFAESTDLYNEFVTPDDEIEEALIATDTHILKYSCLHVHNGYPGPQRHSAICQSDLDARSDFG